MMATRTLAVGSRSMAAADSSMMTSNRKTTKTYTYKKDSSGNITSEVHTHVDSSNDANLSKIRKLEERIRVITEDLDAEQHFRQKIEKEKQEYQLQIIQLSERLTDAEGGAANQLDINRKREAEMAKLRKLLEDVHMESEQAIHELKKKQQQSMMEMQEQIEFVSRSKEKITKEKSKMQQEISELLARIDILNEEKVSIRKVVEKLEIQVHEYNMKNDKLNKSMIELQSQKTRLSQEKEESLKKFNDMRLAIETAGLDKNKIVSQLKELQVNLDNVTRAKMSAETRVKNLEHSLKVATQELDDIKIIRTDLDKMVIKYRDEVVNWKKKYETEAQLRVDDVEALKKKFNATFTDLQDKLDSAISRLKMMEQQKNKLNNEITILNKDLDNSNTTIKEISNNLHISEKRNEELVLKLKEMTNLYEKADRDNKTRAQEIVKISNEMDRCIMENEVLKKDKGKLQDEVNSYKTELDNVSKRFLAVEQENRKLAHDREELARALKDADAGKQKAFCRIQELETESKKIRAEADRRLSATIDEASSTKKKLVTEIEVLTIRLQETEAKLRNEVDKIKKKMCLTISELEMSLDAANKNNTQLQNQCKLQTSKIMELNNGLGESQKNLANITSQCDTTTKKLQIIEGENHEIKNTLSATINSKKISDTKINEMSNKITELMATNKDITQIRTRIEKELTSITNDYNDIARELKLADERANKFGHDAQHFESLLHEEQHKSAKLDNSRRALENEVKSLTVTLEEIESNTVQSSRRTIQKMEMRIEELESIVSKEKTMHMETTTLLHKKDRSIKELLLQSEEDRKNIIILQESLDKLNEKIKMYKRQLEEQENIANSNIMRVKKFQRELECAENRAEEAESSLNQFRSRQRVYVNSESRKEVVHDEVDRSVVVKHFVHGGSGGGEGNNTSNLSNNVNGISSTSNRDYRAGSSFSRAGSVARATSTIAPRATLIARAGSVLRY